MEVASSISKAYIQVLRCIQHCSSEGTGGCLIICSTGYESLCWLVRLITHAGQRLFLFFLFRCILQIIYLVSSVNSYNRSVMLLSLHFFLGKMDMYNCAIVTTTQNFTKAGKRH